MPRLWHPLTIPGERSLKAIALASFFLFASCRPASISSENKAPELIVATAANLTESTGELGQQFTNITGVRVIFTFGATADLAKQIENGAPFDVFLAGDVANVERLEKQGLLNEGSRAVYARGKLVLWMPAGSRLHLQRIEDITAPEFERIAIAKPDIAPYGKAAVETLQAVKLWQQIQPRIVYGQNVSQAKQFVATGNAEVAFIPLSLVKTGEGSFLEVDQSLHQPIDQGLAVIKNGPNQSTANQFVEFMLSPAGQQILVAKGYRASR